MLIIGDVHAKTEQYKQLLHKFNYPDSIQLGDFGFKAEHDWFLKNIFDPQDTSKHRILFGNHDYLPYVEKDYSLKNWSYFLIEKKSVFTIRGANSVDRNRRTQGLDWFENEQLTYAQMQECIDTYARCRPKIVLSHDCPKQISYELFNVDDNSCTSQGLQQIFEIHKPELWIFGHHHKFVEKVIDGTKFVCLGELQTYWID